MDRQAHGITKSLCLGWIVFSQAVCGGKPYIFSPPIFPHLPSTERTPTCPHSKSRPFTAAKKVEAEISSASLGSSANQQQIHTSEEDGPQKPRELSWHIYSRESTTIQQIPWWGWWDPKKSSKQIFQNTNKSINKSRWILNHQKEKLPPAPGNEEGSHIPPFTGKEKRKLIGLKFRCRLGRDNVMAPGSWTKIMIKSPHWIVHVPWPLLWPLQIPQLLCLLSLREVLQIPGRGGNNGNHGILPYSEKSKLDLLHLIKNIKFGICLSLGGFDWYI